MGWYVEVVGRPKANKELPDAAYTTPFDTASEGEK
jgi:hypothetical protein